LAVNIYSLPRMTLVEGLLDLPTTYLILAPAMDSFDIALKESSKVCGGTILRTLLRVTLPVLRPAILAAFIPSLVRSLASFAVPSVIGMPGRIYVLATHIYQSNATGFAADFGKAAAIGLRVLATSIISPPICPTVCGPWPVYSFRSTVIWRNLPGSAALARITAPRPATSCGNIRILLKCSFRDNFKNNFTAFEP
jgi:hypothetical protein